MLFRIIGALLGIDGLGRGTLTLDDRLGDWSGGSPATWVAAGPLRALPDVRDMTDLSDLSRR